MEIAYETSLGRCFLGKSEEVLASEVASEYKSKVDLIFTSPPFPLNRKKRYGNEQGEEYVEWIAGFAPLLKEFLKPKGSIVMEVGNSWEPGRPVMSTLSLEALLRFLKTGNFSLCQQFIYNNPARLPSPAQWVNVERIRLKDSFTHLWWMATTDRPEADNRSVLTEYSKSMKHLLKTRKYNAGKRPSEYNIGAESFFKDNNGAIPSNVITLANTHSHTNYLRYCREHSITPHPARMPIGLPEFFIKFLTKPGDLVLDPFGGSNTTGAAAEHLGRKWLTVEAKPEYVEGSRGRFHPLFSVT
jgi:site-specific DNA-methyltransferase (cytosine-N4-specific)